MIAGVILAGGLSSRMGGGDKGLALLGGKPILAHVIARLQPQVDHLALNANGDAARFAQFGLPVFADRRSVAKGPIGGLEAALLWAESIGARTLITTTADAPFIPLDLVMRLVAAEAPAVAESNGQQHFAIAGWPVSLRAAVQDAMTTHAMFRMQDWSRRANAKPVTWDCASHDPFFNINTPGDLAEARRICEAFAP